MTTKHGYTLYRTGSNFVVQEERLSYDEASGQVYSELTYHSQLLVFVGLGKDNCKQLVHSWLSFYKDPELIDMGIYEVDNLFEQPKVLAAAPNLDDKDVN